MVFQHHRIILREFFADLVIYIVDATFATFELARIMLFGQSSWSIDQLTIPIRPALPLFGTNWRALLWDVQTRHAVSSSARTSIQTFGVPIRWLLHRQRLADE
jgi:hypothetical protein